MGTGRYGQAGRGTITTLGVALSLRRSHPKPERELPCSSVWGGCGLIGTRRVPLRSSRLGHGSASGDRPLPVFRTPPAPCRDAYGIRPLRPAPLVEWCANRRVPRHPARVATTPTQVRNAIAASIERLDNCQYLHQTYGCRSPEEYEKMAGES